MTTTPSHLRKQILLYVPANVDIKQLMRDNGFSQRQINDHLDKYHYFLHLIRVGELYRYDIDEHNGYTKLNDNYLKPFLQGYRHKVKENLLKWGIVITDNQYITGRKSKGYKIAPEYADRYRKEICINDKFEFKIRHKPAFVNTLKSSEQYLYDNLKQVGIRADEAYTYADNKLAESLSLLLSFTDNHYNQYDDVAEDKDLYTLSEELAKGTIEAMVKNIHDKHDADTLAINSIEHGLFKLTPDKYGRVHTNLTNTSRMLRQFIFFIKQPDASLYSLDLSCSQPFFLNILLKSHYPQDNLPQGVQQYIKDTSAGELYEKLMEEAGILVNRNTRRHYKKKFFGNVYYCSIYTACLKDNTCAKAFKALYPEVFEFIKTMKKGDFREFSRKMQQAESTAFIGRIVTEAQIQGIWVNTIHDSTIVLQQDVQAMYTIIETVFREEYLLNPNIKEERLKDAQAVSLEALSKGEYISVHSEPQQNNELPSPEYRKTLSWSFSDSERFLYSTQGHGYKRFGYQGILDAVEKDKQMYYSDEDYRRNWSLVITNLNIKTEREFAESSRLFMLQYESNIAEKRRVA